ncbi:hypothetical protein BHE74_00025005 [Ensete ventricosum]|nr:hypothetical protein BHE74_00025005 [Ensete ventricosum]RZS03426.1 hypothetical protein BHM03_00033607 [Ensete ventricosum]
MTAESTTRSAVVGTPMDDGGAAEGSGGSGRPARRQERRSIPDDRTLKDSIVGLTSVGGRPSLELYRGSSLVGCRYANRPLPAGSAKNRPEKDRGEVASTTSKPANKAQSEDSTQSTRTRLS